VLKSRCPTSCERPGQAGATCVGPVFGPAFVVRSCPCNAYNALCNRHLKSFVVCVQELRIPDHLVTLIGAAYRNYMPATRLAWLAKWSRDKVAAILRSEHADPFEPGRVKCTLKRETTFSPASAARAIQAYFNLATQARWAVEHCAFQKAVFGVFGGGDIGGQEVYPGIYAAGTSGWSAGRYGEWADFVSGRAVSYYERDGERWDSTMQRVHHEAKWAAMRECDPAFAEAVRGDFVCRGKFGHGPTAIRYTATGTVKSGHNDTTSGNTLINLLIAANAMRDEGATGYILVMGDDLLVALTSPTEHSRLAAREEAAGIKPVYVSPVSLSLATFVSCTWLNVGGRHYFVPLLGRLLAKQWWTVNPPAARKLALYRHGVASGVMSTYADVPLYRDFYGPALMPGVALRATAQHRTCFGALGAGGVDFDHAFAERYGLTAEDVLLLGGWLRGLDQQPGFSNGDPWGYAHRIILRDVPKAFVGDVARDVLEGWSCFSSEDKHAY